jgi:hypothetical protein
VGFKSAKRRRPSRAWLGHLEAARRRRSAPGLRVRVRDEAEEGARWAFAAGSWLGWERARAGTIAGTSWAVLLAGPYEARVAERDRVKNSEGSIRLPRLLRTAS